MRFVVAKHALRIKLLLNKRGFHSLNHGSFEVKPPEILEKTAWEIICEAVVCLLHRSHQKLCKIDFNIFKDIAKYYVDRILRETI